MSRLVLQQMDELADEIIQDMPSQGLRRIAVAFAGPINEFQQITAAPTIWGTSATTSVDLLPDMDALWPDTELCLLNDVTAAGYRYLRDEGESLCVVTVGSGIGNKIFIKGIPFTGPHGRGGEMGHIVIDHEPNAILCDCGGRGHLGGIASGRGSLATARRWASQDLSGFANSILGKNCHGAPDKLENRHLVSAFRVGDEWTSEVIRHVAGKLANVLAQVHQSLGIERFVVYGGFAMALGEKYRQFLVEAARGGCWDSGQEWDNMIELGADDDDSGLLGAGRFATEFYGARK